MKVLPSNRIKEALNTLAGEAEVYAPLVQGDVSGYFKWADNHAEDLALDILNTYMSPKSIVMPQTEPMYKFVAPGKEAQVVEIANAEGPRIIFGIRGCDLQALHSLDLVFLTKGYEDEFYKARRKDLAIIARACYQPGPACFCESMGVDRLNPQADVVIHDLGQRDFAWEPKTPKGEEITSKLQGILVEKDVKLPQAAELQVKIDITGLSEKLAGMFEHPVWDEISSRCMNCGVCTYVCPTCYCFDIQVKTRGDAGSRFRCWDSCMYREYTQMAGGHNPREYKKERFRNRFLHKLQFFNERYGANLCIGCGRCVIMCPNGVNILEVINKLKEVRFDA